MTDAQDPQIQLLAKTLRRVTYPGYPEQADRLSIATGPLGSTPEGRTIIPEGPWHVPTHVNRHDSETVPSPSAIASLESKGLKFDSEGRPLHPWFEAMFNDSDVGIVTGKGAFWNWGPNYAADSIVFQDDKVLLIRRGDTGEWALPGGFVDDGETAQQTAARELEEETGVVLPPDSDTKQVYAGPILDVRNTANAWTETTAFVTHVSSDTELPLPKGNDDALTAEWVPINQIDNYLYSSHLFLVQRALNS